MKVLVLNGPNLNLLGQREVSVYGQQSLSDIEVLVGNKATSLGFECDFFQSNHEGELIDKVQSAQGQYDYIILNPAGLTHTSVSLRDAMLAVSIPFVEVHLSNIFAREPFRHISYFSDIAMGVVSGFGVLGYVSALELIDQRTQRAS